MLTNEKMYGLMMKVDERLDQVQMDLAVIREKHSNEMIQIKADMIRIEREQQEIRNEMKTVQDKLASRDRTLVGILLTSGIGLFIWLLQQGIK